MSDYKPRDYAHKPTTAEKREMGRAGDGHGFKHHADRGSRTRPAPGRTLRTHVDGDDRGDAGER